MHEASSHLLRNLSVYVQSSIIYVVQENTYMLNSSIMSYILNVLICVDMILLDNLLQYFMFIDVIDLSSTFNNTIILIYKSLFMFMIYF
jgi:hypothetical protein